MGFAKGDMVTVGESVLIWEVQAVVGDLAWVRSGKDYHRVVSVEFLKRVN